MNARSLRWLLVRIKHLPPEAAIWRAMNEKKRKVSEKPALNVVSIEEFVKRNKRERR